MKRRFNSVCAIGLVMAAGLAVGVARVRAQGAPPPSNPGRPLEAILSKLDQLIAAVPADVTSKRDLLPTTRHSTCWSDFTGGHHPRDCGTSRRRILG